MPVYFFNRKLCVTLIIMAGFISACDREKPASSQQPTSTEAAPAIEQQEVTAESTATAETESTDKPPVVESAPIEEKETPPIAAEETVPATTAAQTTAANDTPAHADALALARKSGCLACHAVDKKVVGPAWQDVAKRYAGNADARDQLIEKVSKGGKGNWTEVVGTAAMPPYHPRVSKENIERLVDFVLSLADR